MNMIELPRFYLTNQTFTCLTDNTFVFLDLHNDKYMCLESKHTRPFSALLGLPPPSQGGAEPFDVVTSGTDSSGNEEFTKMVKDLTDRGLITQNPQQGKRAELLPQGSDLKELLGYEIGEAPKIRPRHVLNFFKALIIVKLMLRFASMERIVTRVKRRRQRYHKALYGAEQGLERINEMVEIYKILKPLFVTVKDNCLFDAFFLIEFLACYRIYPSWVFGVRLHEFYAHCWVQDGNMIYDDFITNTCNSQPIMSV